VCEEFLALPRERLADAALATARALGATHADFRLERLRTQSTSLRDARLESSARSTDTGYAVRVVVDGTWGFASGVDLFAEAVA
jgi:TldD protein